ncbi:MAG: hypothetical protein KDD50_05505 [Bdellovibrionales bacterium]|nr:hypothetical protein [Bdellovibrionales bacterium]
MSLKNVLENLESKSPYNSFFNLIVSYNGNGFKFQFYLKSIDLKYAVYAESFAFHEGLLDIKIKAEEQIKQWLRKRFSNPSQEQFFKLKLDLVSNICSDYPNTRTKNVG